MPFVSITRLRVKSIFYLFAFMKANEDSVKTLLNSEGLIKGKELVDKNLTFWTITLWDSEEAMKGFRNSVAHRNAMQQLPTWCSEASYHHWIQEENVLPDWPTASDRLFNEGRLSKVRKPSKAQSSNKFPAIKWTKMERVLK